MTIRQLKDLIERLPDDMPVCIQQEEEYFNDYDHYNIDNIDINFKYKLWEAEVGIGPTPDQNYFDEYGEPCTGTVFYLLA
jgi:hypothetical protein